MNESAKTLIENLDTLLEVERLALIAGNVATLSEIVEEKESLIAALSDLEFSEHDSLTTVNNKVLRNQALLEQALEGIRSVAKKLADIRRNRKEFDTYNQLGKRNRIEPDTETSVEKHA